MSIVIVIEIIAAIGVLAAVVRFAVRDTQQRSHDADPQQHSASADISEATSEDISGAPANASEAQAGSEA
ncbi:MAG: hypothetical protein ACRDR6_04865 [Pseudonocardiaceae bacterium]